MGRFLETNRMVVARGEAGGGLGSEWGVTI